MSTFRFENLEIWKFAIEVTIKLLDIADFMEQKRLFGFSNQLRDAALSITNNIAEGSGSFSDKEFGVFLNYSRRSVFECANIIFVLWFKHYISEEIKSQRLRELDLLSKRITAFRKSLKLQ
jgi:four helix bundle protein